MGRIRKNFMDRLLELPEAAFLIERDIKSYQSRCLSNALRNWKKPKDEHIPTPFISEETFKQLAFLDALRKDVAFKEMQSAKGKVSKKDIELDHVFALLDEWADRQQREGLEPNSRGWKEYVFRRLNVSSWRVVRIKLEKLGISEDDLIQRLKDHKPV